MSQLALSLLVSVSDKASSVLKAITGGFGDSKKAVESFASSGAKLKQWGADLRVARENVDDLTSRARAGLESILKPAAEVDDAIANMTASVGPDLEDMAGTIDHVKQASIAWSSQHKQSAAVYISTTTQMMQLGFNEAEALKATEAALRLSTGAHAEAAGATKTLTLLYSQMGDKTKDVGSEMSRMSDVLVRAKQLFPNIDVAALSDPLKDAVPAAKAAKVPVEQLVAVLGEFNKAGLQGGDGGAKFGAILQSLDGASKQLGFTVQKTSNGGVDLVATLAALEKQVGDVNHITPEMSAKLQAAFGPEASKAVITLLGHTTALQNEYGTLTHSNNEATNAQKALEASTTAQWQILQQQLDNTKVTLAAGLTPAIQAIIPPVKSAVEAFGGFAKEHPTLIGILGTILVLVVAVGSVIGPILSVGGALASLAGMAAEAAAGTIAYITANGGLIASLGVATAEAWAFAAAMLANPITWIVLAIVALAAVLYIYWEPISGFFSKIWAGVKSGFVAAWDAILGVWHAVTGFFTGAFAEIKGAFQVSFIGGVMTVLKYLSPLTYIKMAFGAILPWLQGLWGQVRAAFDQGIGTGLTGWNALTNWLFGLSLTEVGKKILDTLWSGVKSGLGFLVDLQKSIYDAIAGVFAFFLPGIKNDLGSVGGVVTGAWASIKGAVSSGIDAVMATIAAFNPVTLVMQGFNAVSAWLSSFSLADAGSNIINTIVEGMKSAANAPIDAMRDVVQGVRNLLPFSPAKEGPLKDLHRVKLVETVASAVNPTPLVDAMSATAGLAMNAISTPAIPPISPAVQASADAAGARAGGNGAPVFQVTISINAAGGDGESVKAALEAWIADPANQGKLASAVQASTQNEQRKGFAQ